MAYIRHDINNNPVSPQPGVSTVSDLGGISGWSTVTYQNYNLDFIARTYNGLSVREVNLLQQEISITPLENLLLMYVMMKPIFQHQY